MPATIRPTPSRPSADHPIRWEWRTFESHPLRWQVMLESIEALAPVVRSAETYLLAPSPDSVKLRDGRIEVKRLVSTDADGLELWRPVLSHPFPLTPGLMSDLCDVWRIPRREVAAEALEDPVHFIDFLRRDVPQVRVVPVRKWRWRFRLGGCDGERVTALIGRSRVEGLALEDHDPERLRETLRRYGLLEIRNTSYATLLRSIFGPLPETVQRRIG